MANFAPIELVVTSPGVGILREAPVGQTVDPTRLPDATGSTKGAAELGDTTPPAIAAAGDVGNGNDVARGNHTHAHGNQAGGALHAIAVPSVSNGFMSAAQAQIVADVPGAIALLQPLAAKDQDNGYLGIGGDGFVDHLRVARARGRNVKFSRGQIDYLPPLLRTRRSPLRRSNHYYGDETTGTLGSSGHRAGAIAIAPDDPAVANGPIHPDAGSFPFINLDSSIDFNGYPNYHGKRFHSSNQAQNSGKDGYELGTRIPAGFLRRNEGQRRRVRARVKNELSDDAFFEFAVEPNHRRGVFNQPSRARLLSGALGFQWTGWCDLIADIEFRYLAGAKWLASASYELFAPTGELVWSDRASASIAGGHNFQTDDTEFLCYQAQVNTWDLVNDFLDYTAQGTGNLELVLVSSETQPLDACR